MSVTDREGSSDVGDSPLDRVVADYLRAVEQGELPDRDELVRHHPELADDLRDFFRYRDRMEGLLDPLRSAADRVLNVRCPHCHHAIELVEHAEVSDLSCPSCGSHFSLVTTGNSECFPGGLKRVGQFQLIDHVGIGQFGSVWKARDLTLERTVAIKIPRNRALSEAEAEMFLRDARLAAQLRHPNIVGVHEVGKHEDAIYIVSDFIHGATLKEWIASKRLTIDEALRLCRKVALALEHAHQAGVVHRDLKPGNLMMDLAGQPHIVDFGLAKRDGGEITVTLDGQILGTPAYMPPEQARGEGHDVDCRADIYSLGVILFELLTGELPFRGDRQMLIVQILNEEPPSPRRLNNQVPRAVETICLKCLRKDPSNRYSTAGELADDLSRFLDHQPIMARPVGPVRRSWLWCRRRPAISALIVLLVAVVLGAGIVAREIQHRERAHGLVNQLITADVADAPELIGQLAPYHRRVKTRLRNEARIASGEGAEQQRLVLNLALLSVQHDRQAAEYLFERLLTANPTEMEVLVQALREHPMQLRQRLWNVADSAEVDPDRRFRAACALAALNPEDGRWNAIAPFLTAQLVTVPLVHLSGWRDHLVPVAAELTEPLKEILFNPNEWIQKRDLAAACLAYYHRGQPETLFPLMMNADEQQFVEFHTILINHPAEFSRLLDDEIRPQQLEPAAGDSAESIRRRALATIAAWRLGEAEKVSSLLRRHPNPGVRTRFIHWAAGCGVDPSGILNHLMGESDPEIRQTLALALGEFNPQRLTHSMREQIAPELLRIYSEDPDPGLHGAIRWLMQKWGYVSLIDQAESKLPTSTSSQTSKKRWSVNAHGHTMVEIAAGDFMMGAPFDVLVATHTSAPMLVKLNRTFAIATTEVSRQQMARYYQDVGIQEERHGPNRYSWEDAHPQNYVTWYDAAAYCNWLSRQEGLPPNQWCYLPNDRGEYADGMRVAPDVLIRSGYRLPTEAEWEYACRAGTTTLFSSGDDLDYLARYAWFLQRHSHHVALLKPNDFGLFDMMGNIGEWYHERRRPTRTKTIGAIGVDYHRDEVVENRANRGYRGAAFSNSPQRMDSGDRSATYRPGSAMRNVGFRVARTIIPAPHDLTGEMQRLGSAGRWIEAAQMLLRTAGTRPSVAETGAENQADNEAPIDAMPGAAAD